MHLDYIINEKEESSYFQFWATTDDLHLHLIHTNYKTHRFIPGVEEIPKCPICSKVVKAKESI